MTDYSTAIVKLTAVAGGCELTAKREVSVARIAERATGKNWDTCDDSDMARVVKQMYEDRTHKAASQRLAKLKNVLYAIHGDDATVRWPSLFGQHYRFRQQRVATALEERLVGDVSRVSAVWVSRLMKDAFADRDWSTVTDSELSGAFATACRGLKRATTKRRHKSLQLVLCTLYANAVERWPSLSRNDAVAYPAHQAHHPRHTMTTESLDHPRTRFRVKPFWLRREIESMATRPTMSMAELLAVVNEGRIARAMHSLYYEREYVNVPPALRACACFRWTDVRQALDLLASVANRSLVVPAHARTMWIVHTHTLYRMCSLLQPCGALMPRLCAVSRSDVVEVLRCHDGKSKMAHLIYQFTHGPCCDLLPWHDNWNNSRRITRRELGYIPNPIVRSRRSFTLTEVEVLFDATKAIPYDHALIRFFVHTGCRRRAATLLRVSDICEADGRLRNEGRVVEKFGEIRTFAIDHELGRAFADHITANAPSQFVFYDPRGGKDTRRRGHDISTWFRRLCASADIRGDHVHVHALRHTTITLLNECGNETTDIQRFIQHKNITTTMGYIDSSPEALRRRMHLPWVGVDAIQNIHIDRSYTADEDNASTSTVRNMEELLQNNQMLIENNRWLQSVYEHLFSQVLTPEQKEQMTDWLRRQEHDTTAPSEED